MESTSRMTVIHYKIRKRSDPELFSKGTMYNQWDKKGKTFDTLGKLRSYITRCMNEHSYMSKFVGEFQIVELEVRETAVKELVDIVDPKKVWDLLKK